MSHSSSVFVFAKYAKLTEKLITVAANQETGNVWFISDVLKFKRFTKIYFLLASCIVADFHRERVKTF